MKSKGINVLSLFDGMSCGQIALNRLGIKISKYYASEIDKAPIKVTQHNYPETIQVGDVTKLKGEDLPQIDLLIGGSPCFTGENLVMTSNGYVPIKEIKVGDMVLTHQNRYRKVLQIGGEKKETIIIKSQGSTKIETTKNHPFYCFEENNQDFKFTWKNIGEFKKEDKVVSINWGITKDLENFSDIDLYIMGRFLADGCCWKTKRKNRKDSYIYKFKISVGKHELEDFKNKVDDRFSYIEERTVFNAFIYKKEWVELGENFGHLAHNKFIPNFILDLPVERLKIFLQGYMDGDGHIRKQASKVNIYKRNTTVSEKLALTLSLAIQKCYNGVSIYHTKRKDKHIIENRVVNQKDSYEVSYSEYEPKFSKYKSFKSYTTYNLTKSISFKESGINNVYNIEVEEDNSYIVNNLIVHNCQGFSFAGKKLNFEDPRSILFFEFVRLLDECKPKYFLLENVKMKKEWQDVISNLLGVQPIRINSSKFIAAKRDRLYWTNIPNITEPIDKEISFDDINSNIDEWIESERIERIAAWKAQQKPLKNATLIGSKSKLPCLTARGYNQYHSGMILITNGEKYRYLTNEEAEMAQGVPVGYTSICTDRERSHMLGNGWTVDVIAHIFSPLKNEL